MIPLPSLSLRAVLALLGGLALAASLAWGLRVDHLRGSYKQKLIEVTGKLVEVTQRLNGFRAEIVDMTNEALERDRAHAADVQARYDAIARGSAHDYRTRIADARARAVDAERRLRAQAGGAGRGGGAAEDMSGAGTASGGVDEEAGADRLSGALLRIEKDALCTAQAIQLDELISWVERSVAVTAGPSGEAVAGAVQQP